MAKINKKKREHRWFYFTKTSNYLPASKKLCRTMGEAIVWIEKVAAMKKNWVTDGYLHRSYHITKIDSKELPEFRKIFMENVKMTEPEEPSRSELGLRKPKSKKNP